ncbi:hypothetical protein ACSBR2_042113 [Camellia fascicularis]
MSQIQQLGDQNDSSEDEQTRVSLRKEELQVFVIRTVHHTVQEAIEKNLMPLISRVVKQEIELAGEKFLASLKQSSGSGIHSVESRSFQLKFLNKLSLPVLTGKQIKGEGDIPIGIALFDTITEQLVNSGPEASAKVEIVVVEGDFDGDTRSNSALEDFNNKIVREKEGRKSLLSGNVYLNLKEGIGFVGEISFTHNANWMKRCELRLGAKVVDNFNGTRVREALTESFFVKDRRSTLYGKHYPPHLHDEVWRLKNIGKDGPFHDRLCSKNINTVKDFLTQYFINPRTLQDILGTSMTTKMWEATVDHARTCTLDNRLHLYFPINSQKKTGVVFNAVGQVMGLLLDYCYILIDNLPEHQKADARKLVLSAFEHMDEVVSFDNETSMHAFLQSLDIAAYSNSPWLESLGDCYVDTDDGYDHTQPSISSHANEVSSFDDDTSLIHDSLHLSNGYTSYSLSLENPNSFNFETSHFNDGYVQPGTSSLGISSFFPSYGSTSNLNEYGLHRAENEDHLDDQPFSSPGNFVKPLVCYAESITQSFCEDEHLPSFDTDHSVQYQNSNFESEGDLQSIVNGFLSRAAVARRSWTLLFGVLRWYSRRKIAALKFVSSEKIHATKKSRIY